MFISRGHVLPGERREGEEKLPSLLMFWNPMTAITEPLADSGYTIFHIAEFIQPIQVKGLRDALHSIRSLVGSLSLFDHST